MNARARLRVRAVGAAVLLSMLGGCVAPGYQGDVGVGYVGDYGDYYEPYGADYGYWGPGYWVGPPGWHDHDRDHGHPGDRDHDRGGGHFWNRGGSGPASGPAFRPGHNAPSIPHGGGGHMGGSPGGHGGGGGGSHGGGGHGSGGGGHGGSGGTQGR